MIAGQIRALQGIAHQISTLRSLCDKVGCQHWRRCRGAVYGLIERGPKEGSPDHEISNSHGTGQAVSDCAELPLTFAAVEIRTLGLVVRRVSVPSTKAHIVLWRRGRALSELASTLPDQRCHRSAPALAERIAYHIKISCIGWC
jgi:hypothetical protein